MQLWQTAASLDLPVFPCLPDKRPACQHGFKDATSDKRHIRDLFLSHPTATLIGVPSGEGCGVDFLDLDTTKHPAETRAWITPRRELLAITRAHRTQSGGVHYLFQHHPGMKNWTAKPAPGIDGRADGGYVVWWPAMGLPANSKPISKWPEPLLRQFTRAHQRDPAKRPPANITDERLERIIRRIVRANEGTRNKLLFWGACRVGEWIKQGTLPQECGEAVLLHAARYLNLPDREAIATIYSAFNITSH